MSVTIYHNPDCGTSRNVLAVIEAAGYSPEVVEYLQAGWTRDRLLKLFADAGLTPRQALRETKSPARDMGLLEPGVSDERLLAAMVAEPVLVNRPFVVTPKGTKLCRPSEVVLDLLDRWPAGPFLKEDGEVMIDADGLRWKAVAPDAPDLIAALTAEAMPIDDLAASGRLFWGLDRTGAAAGFVGLERHGAAALLRSLVVLPGWQGRGIGKRLVSAAVAQAKARQVQDLWLLTKSAEAFFTGLGWRVRDRSEAPVDIAVSAQFAGLCPASAVCMSFTVG